jgi:hypothetical protein
MWEDDPHWYPEALAGKNIKKRFYFDEDGHLLNFENI